MMIMAQSHRNLVVLVLLCSILYVMYFGDGTQSFLDSYMSTVVERRSSSEWDALYATNDNSTTTTTRRNIPNNTNPNETFSACLLVMDENFRLREWLSYHYHVLPLRHLVVATDPRSQTSPTSILHQFRNVLHMNIVEWTSDEDFGFDPVRLMQETVPKRQRRHQKEPPPPNPRAIYLGRQRQFLQSCLEYFHQQGHTWTACIDPDEYVTIDPETTNASFSFVGVTGQAHHHLRQPGVVMDYIHKAKALHTLPKEECIILPRRQVGAIDTDGSTNPNLLQATTSTTSTSTSRKRAKRGKVKKDESSFLDLDRLDTFRWRLYNEEKYGKVNGLGKPLVDVSALGPHLPLQVVNPHRIQRQLCASPFPEWALGKFGFRGNHYIGSWQAYSYRQGDPRKGVDKSQEVSLLKIVVVVLQACCSYPPLPPPGLGDAFSIGHIVGQLDLYMVGWVY